MYVLENVKIYIYIYTCKHHVGECFTCFTILCGPFDSFRAISPVCTEVGNLQISVCKTNLVET